MPLLPGTTRGVVLYPLCAVRKRGARDSRAAVTVWRRDTSQQAVALKIDLLHALKDLESLLSETGQ